MSTSTDRSQTRAWTLAPDFGVAKLHEGMEQGTVQVFDPLGREVAQQRINTATAVVEVPIGALAPGLYVAVLNGEGLRIGSFKFELVR